ncbi:MAG: hypothetical protein PHH49_04770 [Candidatus Omnitrophica bacterium]|nr:hypothetical protein [Candidatus Omnitrophota bacterium]MDD5488258.1 hypothetical protein [Candidatus Omnitrophota bacterium]
MGEYFSEQALSGLDEIQALSAEVNGAGDQHDKALLRFIEEHAAEIKDLYDEKDGHYMYEAGDLIILCMELIKSSGGDPDTILRVRYGKFREKIAGILRDRKNK